MKKTLEEKASFFLDRSVQCLVSIKMRIKQERVKRWPKLETYRRIEKERGKEIRESHRESTCDEEVAEVSGMRNEGHANLPVIRKKSSKALRVVLLWGMALCPSPEMLEERSGRDYSNHA